MSAQFQTWLFYQICFPMTLYEKRIRKAIFAWNSFTLSILRRVLASISDGYLVINLLSIIRLSAWKKTQCYSICKMRLKLLNYFAVPWCWTLQRIWCDWKTLHCHQDRKPAPHPGKEKISHILQNIWCQSIFMQWLWIGLNPTWHEGGLQEPPLKSVQNA